MRPDDLLCRISPSNRNKTAPWLNCYSLVEKTRTFTYQSCGNRPLRNGGVGKFCCDVAPASTRREETTIRANARGQLRLLVVMTFIDVLYTHTLSAFCLTRCRDRNRLRWSGEGLEDTVMSDVKATTPKQGAHVHCAAREGVFEVVFVNALMQSANIRLVDGSGHVIPNIPWTALSTAKA